jgi:hypothetical protein
VYGTAATHWKVGERGRGDVDRTRRAGSGYSRAGTVAVSRNPVADQGGTACALSGVCIADVGKEFYARFSAIASLQ